MQAWYLKKKKKTTTTNTHTYNVILYYFFFFSQVLRNILLVCLNNKHQSTKVLSKNTELVSVSVARTLDA